MILTLEKKREIERANPGTVAFVVKDKVACLPNQQKYWEAFRDKYYPGYGLFREETGNKNWVVYDPRIYCVGDASGVKILRCMKYVQGITLPINCSSCCAMFANMNIDVLILGDEFDSSLIVDMSYMFANTKVSRVADFNHRLNTANVVTMKGMFKFCSMPQRFMLDDAFNTVNVTNMCDMFSNASFYDDFSLGENFDTSSLVDCNSMFESFVMPSNFTLGSKFYTNSLRNVREMFMACRMSDSFRLPESFDISNAPRNESMFYNCKFPSGISCDAWNSTECVEKLGGAKIKLKRMSAVDFLEDVLSGFTIERE